MRAPQGLHFWGGVRCRHVTREGPFLWPSLPVTGTFGLHNSGRERQRHNKGHRGPGLSWVGPQRARDTGFEEIFEGDTDLRSGSLEVRLENSPPPPFPIPSWHHDSGQDSRKRPLPRAGNADQRQMGLCGSGRLRGQLLTLQNDRENCGSRGPLLCAKGPCPRARMPLSARHGPSRLLSLPQPCLVLHACNPASSHWAQAQRAQALLTSVLPS